MYTDLVNSFLKNLRALEIYVDNVDPLSLGSPSDFVEEFFPELILLLGIFLEKQGKSLDEVFPNDIKTQDEIFKKLFDAAQIYIKDIPTNIDKTYFNSLESIAIKRRKLQAFLKQKEILYRGSLMILITYFENLISLIMRKDFELYPKRIELDTKSVTFDMLEEYKSIEDVRVYLIEDEVMKMMYKSFDVWIEYFHKKVKLKLDFLQKHINEIREIFARRNLYAHNDGTVNSIYLDLVDPKYREGLKKGDKIKTDKNYIKQAMELIELAGISLIVELWIHNNRKQEEEIEKIIPWIFDEYLANEKWNIGLVLYQICIDSKNLSKANKLLCQINQWQCYKWLNRFDEVKNDVISLDTSAYSVQYQLCKLALLDNDEEFFELFESQKELTVEELLSWPLFKNLRESDRCKKYLPNETETENDNIDTFQIKIENEQPYQLNTSNKDYIIKEEDNENV